MDEHAMWQEQLSAYLDGELAPEDTAALTAHLESCETCRSALALLRGMSAVMREDQAEPPAMLAEGTRYLFERERGAKRVSLRRWRFTAIAAVICVALLGVYRFVPRGSDSLSKVAPATDYHMKYTAAMETTEAEAPAAEEPAAESDIPDLSTGAGGAASSMEAQENAEDWRNSMAPAPMASAAVTEGGETEWEVPAADGGDGLGLEENKSMLYTAAGLPGYSVYQELEDPDQYYSVCFVYGAVPKSIRENRECTPLDAPEGQERWLVPLSVCLNEGLQEQFREIYYGDLLAQQGLVIGLLDQEEEKWLP